MMFWISTALANSIVADVAPACTFDMISATLPVEGETDVAVDVLPTFFLSDCGAPESSGIASVYAGGELVFEERISDHGGVHSFLEVPVELEPDTDYELWLAPTGAEELVLSFSTGNRRAEDGAGAPEVTVDPEWTWYRKSAVASFWLEFSAAQDPEGVSYVEALGPDGEIWGTMLMTREGPHTLSGDVTRSSRPSDVCLTLSHRQADGEFLDGEPVCSEGPVGCATTGLALGGLPVLLSLCALRRRR